MGTAPRWRSSPVQGHQDRAVRPPHREAARHPGPGTQGPPESPAR
ncbi:hypothetical protein ACFFX0_03720 [Citricoccus parietis]|uniref:Uncharacterized protein n=1 Tax=Citricoccus parietis TaxID=592307 RepID=A0ABV5FV60_9MICC